MLGIKFNDEMIKKCIETYHFQYGEYPYLIMNEKTRKLIPNEDGMSYYITSDNFNISLKPENAIHNISINDKKYVEEPETITPKKSWYGAKILIDNDLDFGEVHVG